MTESETVSHSETFGESSSKTRGRAEGIHKRPLITPDELGRFFSRVDDPSSPAHPGLGLVLLPGRGPVAVRRTNYFTDPQFIGLFDPHPDHPMQVRELPAPVVLESYQIGIDGLDKLRFLNGHPGGPDPDAQWLIGPGSSVRIGDAVLRVSGLIGKGWGVPEFPGTLTFESPVAGEVVDCRPLDVPGLDRWMMTVAGKKHRPDWSVVSDNDDAVWHYCRSVKTLGRRIVTRIQLTAGVMIGLALTSFVWLIVGWPSRLLMGGLLAVLVLGLAVYAARNLVRLLFLSAVATIPIEDLEGGFVIEGPSPHNPGSD